jgi:hypothetical protein
MSKNLTQPELDNYPCCGEDIAELCSGIREAFDDPWVTYKCLEFIECGEIFTVFASGIEGRDDLLWHGCEYQGGNEFLPSSLVDYEGQIEVALPRSSVPVPPNPSQLHPKLL